MRKCSLLLICISICWTLKAADITSSGSGAWNTAGTWDSGVPVGTDNVIIDAGDTVTLDVSPSIVNLTVNAGAVLDLTSFNITITGNLIINGSIMGDDGSTTRLFISGSGDISGTGSVESGWRTSITGDRDILVGSDLTWSGGTQRFTIADNVTITNYGSISLRNEVRSGGSNSAWVNETNSTLAIRNSLFANDSERGTKSFTATGNTVIYSGGDQSMDEPQSNTYYNLSIAGTGTKTLETNIIVLGDLSISSELNVTNSNRDIDLHGSWTNTGFFNEQNGEVNLIGTTDQTISNTLTETFHDLIINKASGDVILEDDIIIEGDLTMTTGDIQNNGNRVILGTGTSNPGVFNYTSGTIIGEFERWLITESTDYDFPIGSTSESRNLRLNFTNLTDGSLTVEFVADAPGNGGLPVNDNGTTIYNTFTEGYWKLTPANNLESSDYEAFLTASSFNSFPISTGQVLTRNNEVSAWETLGTHVASVGSIANRENLSGLSKQLAVGDVTMCDLEVTSTINPLDGTVICTGASQTYSVTLNSGNTYNWQVTGGTFDLSGTDSYSALNANSIEIDWGSVGGTYTISVSETNTCGTSETVSLEVTVNPIATSGITGNLSISSNTTNEPYSVQATSGYNYTWSLPSGGGTFDGGTNTGNAIAVDWGSTAGDYTLQVDATPSGGCAAPALVFVDVMLFDEFVTAQSGNWSDGSTWVGGNAPTEEDNIRIASGHTLTVDQDTSVIRLTVEENAVLDIASFFIQVNGDIIIDGSIVGDDGSSTRLQLSTADKTISGSGTVESGWRTSVTNNRSVLAGSDLSWTGGTQRFTMIM